MNNDPVQSGNSANAESLTSAIMLSPQMASYNHGIMSGSLEESGMRGPTSLPPNKYMLQTPTLRPEPSGLGKGDRTALVGRTTPNCNHLGQFSILLLTVGGRGSGMVRNKGNLHCRWWRWKARPQRWCGRWWWKPEAPTFSQGTGGRGRERDVLKRVWEIQICQQQNWNKNISNSEWGFRK